jgi:anti-anti-sigma factor
MITPMSHPRLGIARLSGEHGPILRCSGELSAATAGALGSELALALPVGHSVLLLNLSECNSVGVEGLLTILDAFKRLRREGHRLVLVAGRRRLSRLLHTTGIARIVSTFPSEKVAAWALRGGGPPERGGEAGRMQHPGEGHIDGIGERARVEEDDLSVPLPASREGIPSPDSRWARAEEKHPPGGREWADIFGGAGRR